MAWVAGEIAVHHSVRTTLYYMVMNYLSQYVECWLCTIRYGLVQYHVDLVEDSSLEHINAQRRTLIRMRSDNSFFKSVRLAFYITVFWMFSCFNIMHGQLYIYIHQGWKLQAVRLSGTGKNRTGQVKILDTFPKERLKFWKLLSVFMSRTGKNSAGQVNVFDTFPKERLKYFVISTPVLCVFDLIICTGIFSSQMWVMPFILANALVTGICFVSGCILSVGFALWCQGVTSGDKISRYGLNFCHSPLKKITRTLILAALFLRLYRLTACILECS